MAKVGVVLGVSGQIGSAVARAMLARGWTVRGLHLPGDPLPGGLDGVEAVTGDRDDDAVLERLIRDGADGLVDTVAYNSRHGGQLAAHSGGLGAIVVISSVAAYADESGEAVDRGVPRLSVPVREDHPLVPASDDTYGGGKVLLEEVVLNEARSPVTALRPAAVCGPNSRHLREWWLVKRVLDGRRVVPLKFEGASRFHPSSTANVAELTVHCLGLRSSQVLNAVDPDCPTVHDIAAGVAHAMGHRWRLLPLSAQQPAGMVGDTPWTAPYPVVLDASRAVGLGYRPATTYLDGIAGLVDAAVAEVGDRDWRSVYPRLAEYPEPLFDYAVEDEFLERAGLL